MKVAAFVALLGVAVPAAGQSIGANIAGVVTDTSGARVTGATITISNVANGRSQTLTTGEQGEFRIVALQPAPYRLVVESPGFARSERDLVLNVGSEATLEVRLTVAGVRETIEVAPASFDVAKSQPSSLVTSDDVRTLPEIGRNSSCGRSCCRVWTVHTTPGNLEDEFGAPRNTQSLQHVDGGR